MWEAASMHAQPGIRTLPWLMMGVADVQHAVRALAPLAVPLWLWTESPVPCWQWGYGFMFLGP